MKVLSEVIAGIIRNDSPSERSSHLQDETYFRQTRRFKRVTTPPLDPTPHKELDCCAMGEEIAKLTAVSGLMLRGVTDYIAAQEVDDLCTS